MIRELALDLLCHTCTQSDSRLTFQYVENIVEQSWLLTDEYSGSIQSTTTTCQCLDIMLLNKLHISIPWIRMTYDIITSTTLSFYFRNSCWDLIPSEWTEPDFAGDHTSLQSCITAPGAWGSPSLPPCFQSTWLPILVNHNASNGCIIPAQTCLSSYIINMYHSRYRQIFPLPWSKMVLKPVMRLRRPIYNNCAILIRCWSVSLIIIMLVQIMYHFHGKAVYQSSPLDITLKV